MAETTAQTLEIVVYSDDSSVRRAIASALGTQVALDIPAHRIREFATGDALRAHIDGMRGQAGKKIDLFILDGEAVPEGGMGLAKEINDEVFNAPPIVVLVGRIQDQWLASWSGADRIVTHPIDAFILSREVADVLRARALSRR